ncbi:MAG: hypothetical protein M0Q24_06670 [Sulfurimonas sp.]|uniref:hypothetical protein n=1 Tax=Sulfurimonas sp. TaxID=2022749 RepID=UPI0025F93C7C|nr:hypothetical protein [Sulfurimonas sp.]MCK9491756.1 hypothetical protein [Sulfurimonas sp.]
MCFVISFILLVLSYNLFMASNLFLALASLLGAIFFIYLMLRNIIRVREIKKGKK